MNNADLEWREMTRNRRQVANYRTSAEFFSIQMIVDKMMQNLKSGGMGRVTDQLAALGIPPGSSVLDIGAGPGTFAVPSQPMILAMDQYRQFRNVDAQIDVIPAAGLGCDVWKVVGKSARGEVRCKTEGGCGLELSVSNGNLCRHLSISYEGRTGIS